MARFAKDKRVCPFCGAGKESHELVSAGNGWHLHMGCTVCGGMGPRVPVPEQAAWYVIHKGRHPELARRARVLFYGVPDPVLSSRIPTHH